MKRTAIAALVLLAAACASSNNPNIPKPELNLEQLVAPADVGYATGATQIQYALHALNKATEPIKLTRIEISSVGTGSYVLRRENLRFNTTIAPGTQEEVTFWVHAYAFATDPYHTPSNEPVTLRAIIYFDAPSGPFQQIVTKYLTQFGER
jgi:hypothetical protein